MSIKDQGIAPEAVYDARQLHLLDLIGERGECSKIDVRTYDPFFPPRGGSDAEARRICGRCPIQMQCLEFAFDTDQKGFWGGMSEQERNRMKRQSAA